MSELAWASWVQKKEEEKLRRTIELNKSANNWLGDGVISDSNANTGINTTSIHDANLIRPLSSLSSQKDQNLSVSTSMHIQGTIQSSIKRPKSSFITNSKRRNPIRHSINFQ